MPITLYKILVVEDEQIMRDHLVAWLSKDPLFQVTHASNGREGLYSALSSIPDLILLDIRMPQMDGIEMFERLRRDPRGRDIPVIFLTNYDTDENTLKIISQGKAAYYLLKASVSMDDVVNKVKDSLKLQGIANG